MKMTHENYGQVTVISLQGEMTLDDIEAFKKLIAELIEKQTCDFVLDTSKLEFIDSRGLESLLWLQDHAGERLGQVRLVSPTENVRTILRMTRLERTFDAHADLDAALKSLH